MSKDKFLGYINPLKDKIKQVKFDEKYLNLLIIVPENFVSIKKKMSLVVLDGKKGRSTLIHLEYLKNADGIKIFKVPYLLLNVENGKMMKGLSPDDCVKRFKKCGRSGLTANEGVMLVTFFPKIIREHHLENLENYIDLPGSRYGADHVPCFYVYFGRPGLYSYASGALDRRWGSASCGSRLGP